MRWSLKIFPPYGKIISAIPCAINLNYKHMKTGKALLGVAAGVAAGAVLGMIFYPEKKTGRKLTSEKDLKEALNEKINEKFDELIHAVTEKQNRN